MSRYNSAVEILEHAGIKTTKSGAAEYISLRHQWDRYITLIAPLFAYDLDEINLAVARVKRPASV